MTKPEAPPQKYAMDELAGIEYRGAAGSTRCCVDAVYQLIQCRVVIANTLILTCNGSHGLLIESEYGDKIAIKTGFASGYQGTGPTGLSKVIRLLHDLNIEIDEVLVPQELLERLDQSALLGADLDWLATAPRKRPLHLYDYVRERHVDAPECQQPWWDFEPVMPFSLIDERLSDLAGGFFDAPDEALLKGFRRLESLVRNALSPSVMVHASSQRLFKATLPN